MNNKRRRCSWKAALLIASAWAIVTPRIQAQACNLSEYRSLPGLTATADGNKLVVTWEGERNEEMRMSLTLNGGEPSIQELAVRRKGSWATLASNLSPEYRVTSGLRRMTDQHLRPLQQLGIKITPEILDQDRWEAFWDAPLNVPGADSAHLGATPPAGGIAGQPGLPRKPEEVRRASAQFQVRSCTVKTNGERLEISYPGVQLGIFSGALQYTVYKASNLIAKRSSPRPKSAPPPTDTTRGSAAWRSTKIPEWFGGTPAMRGKNISLAAP